VSDTGDRATDDLARVVRRGECVVAVGAPEKPGGVDGVGVAVAPVIEAEAPATGQGSGERSHAMGMEAGGMGEEDPGPLATEIVHHDSRPVGGTHGGGVGTTGLDHGSPTVAECITGAVGSPDPIEERRYVK
jgi:hypothetical protein